MYISFNQFNWCQKHQINIKKINNTIFFYFRNTFLIEKRKDVQTKKRNGAKEKDERRGRRKKGRKVGLNWRKGRENKNRKIYRKEKSVEKNIEKYQGTERQRKQIKSSKKETATKENFKDKKG